MKRLNKETLIRELSKKIVLPLYLIEKLFNSIIKIIVQIIQVEQRLNLQKFGKFVLIKACKTGKGLFKKKQKAKEKLYLSFHPSRSLKSFINNGYIREERV